MVKFKVLRCASGMETFSWNFVRIGAISGIIFLACFIRAVAALMGTTIFFSNFSLVSPSLTNFLKASTS